jgi:hypothetical protein
VITSSDLNVAYQTSKVRMNFERVNEGVLFRKARDMDHCSPTCEDIGDQAWTVAFNAWADAERAILNPDPVPTAFPRPSDPNAAAVYISPVQRIDSGAGVKTVAIRVPGTQLTNVTLTYNFLAPAPGDASSVLITDLKIVNNSGSPLIVENIRIYQGIKTDLGPADLSPGAGTTYGDVSKVIDTGSSPLLSTANALLSSGDGPNFVFVFAKLQISPTRACRKLASFETTVMPTLNGRCVRCHGSASANADARGAWPMATSSSLLCGQALQRADLNSPSSSVIIRYPYAGQNGHPIEMTATQRTNIMNWIVSER